MSKLPFHAGSAASNIGPQGVVFVGPNIPFVGTGMPFVYTLVCKNRPFVKNARISGFSLLELMFVLVVAGILAGIALPNLQLFVKNSRVKGTAGEFSAALNLARSEAIKRAGTVTVCIRLNDTTCDTGASASWSQGWIVYSGASLSTGIAMNIHAPLATPLTLTSSDFTLAASYGASGRANSAGSFKLCDDRAGNLGRTIEIASTGRVAVQTATCP